MSAKRPAADDLTERELEILHCLAEGLSNQEIANRLHLAEKTVRWYNSQIYSKLGVSGRKEAVAQAQAAGLLDTPKEASVGLDSHNLPLQATTFVGRQRELDELAGLLDSAETRLLTILAPGGMGKTRLALAVAERRIQVDVAAGVFLVPLVPLTSPDQILIAIAEALDFSFSGSGPPLPQLLDFLRPRRLLLVLDNFEHLLEGAGIVAEILQHAPQVAVLATSREKLNLKGETVYSLSGLHFPDWETPADALEYDAVKLFMQTAQRARPDFELQARDLVYLARICRMTAGMPLAVELAAGWVDALTLDQIAAEIQQGIDILETELRDVPDRHRSVRVSFNYSWSRLDEAERQVFMKLAVFRGGFTAAAAQVTVGATPRHLRKLVDKALVQIMPTGRYDIHELLRQYAEGHLTNAGEADKVRQLHSGYFLDFLRQREPDIKGIRQLETLEAIEADYKNIVGAWRWGLRHDSADAIRQAVETLSIYVHTRTIYQFEAEQLFRQASEQFSEETQPRAWAKVTLRHIFLLQHGVFSSENPFRNEIKRCMAIGEAHDDLAEVALAKRLLAIHNYVGRSYDPAAVQLVRDALAIYEALDEPGLISNALKWIGILSPDLNTAQEYFEKSLAVAREAGNSSQALLSLNQIVQLHLFQGRYSLAEQACEESIAMSSTLDDQKLLSFTRFRWSLVKFLTGRFAEAQEFADEGLRIGERYGSPLNEYIASMLSALFITLDQDALLRSQPWLEDTLANLSRFPEFEVVVLTAKALASYGLEDRPSAWREALQSLRESTRQQYMPFRLAALTVVAMLLADEGEQGRAVELLGLALDHPVSPRGWLEQLPLLSRKCEQLESELGADDYAVAWERGQALVLESVIEGLLVEFADSEVS